MTIIARWKILVVEDHIPTYHEMERAVQREATFRDLDINLIHATSFQEAKEKTKAYLPHVISMDMNYPIMCGSHSDPQVGAAFVSFVERRFKKVPYLIYTGDREPETKAKLATFGITRFPTIIQKNILKGHERWSKATLDLLLARPDV